MNLCRVLPSWICNLIACMGGCLGCCSKPPTGVTIGSSPKRLRNRDRKRKQDSISKDLWSASAGDMDYGGGHLQRSVSSIDTFNQPVDPYINAGSSSNPSEFVNHGLLLWTQTRQKWLASKRSLSKARVREPTIRWNATYENLLGTNKSFNQPIPLAEMVDFLVYVWEQDGLYD